MITIDDLLDNEDEKRHAICFIKKVFNPENNLKLSEIQKSFDLDFIKKHLDKIKINDIIDEKLEKNIINPNNHIIKKDLLYKQIFEIIPKDDIGIKTSEIANCIRSKNKINISMKDIHNKIYHKLLLLEKKGNIKSYKYKNKLFWIKL